MAAHLLLALPARAQDVATVTDASVVADAPADEPSTIAPAATELTPATEPSVRWTPLLQLRAREEVIAHPLTGTVGSYTVATRYRVRGGLTGQYRALTVNVQVQAIGVFGEGIAPKETETTVGLHQGYAQLSHLDSWLRLGRQEMSFGDQRMIGSLDWLMSARSLDALRMHTEHRDWSVDVFGAVTRAQADHVDQECVQWQGGDATGCPITHSSGDYVGGVYSMWTPGEAVAVDLYLLYRHDGANAADHRLQRDIASPGARVVGKAGGIFRYKWEGMYQLGSVSGAATPRYDHMAAAMLGEAGLELASGGGAVLAVGGAYATGAGTRWREFDNFFPANHRIYGLSDLIGLRNLQQEYVTFAWTDAEHDLSGCFGIHLLALANGQARWTNAPGDLVATPVDDSTDDRFLGSSWDALLRYTPSNYFWVEAGYSVFQPAAGARRYGKSDPVHFLYLWTEARLP